VAEDSAFRTGRALYYAPMILGLGIDRIEIDRVRSAWNRHGERFHRRVFTDDEWGYCLSRPDPASSMAARFAAKEATMKALGLGWGSGIRYRDIEIRRGTAGAPNLKLHGHAADFANYRDVSNAVVSLTHDRTHAMATVILERVGTDS
jgi:holo-[acyl-carrier protein] synthase